MNIWPTLKKVSLIIVCPDTLRVTMPVIPDYASFIGSITFPGIGVGPIWLGVFLKMRPGGCIDWGQQPHGPNIELDLNCFLANDWEQLEFEIRNSPVPFNTHTYIHLFHFFFDNFCNFSFPNWGISRRWHSTTSEKGMLCIWKHGISWGLIIYREGVYGSSVKYLIKGGGEVFVYWT